MKVDQLMDAIEEIDDRYIEENAYGVRRKSRIPWGMIITAACFCMVIGATMFMQSLGILPHLNGTEGTSQPMTTKPSDTTEPSNTTEPPETTDPVDDSAVMEEIKALFEDKNGWYYRALVDEFDSPKNLHLRYYFYNSTDFGEGLQPTKEEMEDLMELVPVGGTTTLVILPVSKMDAILTEVFDITVAEMDSSAFAGMKYAESIDSWCFWDIDILNVSTSPIQRVEKVAGDIYRVVYEMPYIVPELAFNPRYEPHEIRVKVHSDSCHILSNILIGNNEQPTEPPKTRPSVEEFFSDRENWQNLLILPAFADPTQFDLRPIYLRAMDGENTYATDLEHEKLASMIPGYSRDKLFRATKAQLDTVMLTMFNITTDQLASDWEDNFTYLEETGCYYARLDNSRGYTVYIDRTEESDDGTVLMYYALARGEEPYMVARLQPHETGYYILSNERYVDNTGKSEDQIAMEALFGDYTSWFNRAISCEYALPKEMSLRKFFYGGFKGEPQDPTDQEREQLENLGINLNYDLMRLPVDKMNEVLTQYFGITLADMEPEAFGGLVYLESTNCYYHSTSGWLGVDNFEALSVERMDDGRILVRYPHMNEEYVVTLKPHGESYLILSNERYVDNTGKSEDQIAMEELFKGSSWYNQALTCEYDSPEQIGILSFFNKGFSNHMQVTDEEKAQLKNMQGFGSPAGDICRLPQDKMNEVLTECFGITLEDVNPTGFNGLAYLESTNCYYFKVSSPNFVGNFKADRVERNADGTIDIYYSISYKGDYVVTVKPHGDSYRILSNRCINSTSLTPPTPTEPTGDTELEILFADYAKVSEKEATKKMVDAFLADPDNFVKLLAKQSRDRAILGVLSRNVTDHHPQIGAYRAAVSDMLAMELPEKEENVVYGMAVYSGLSNYIPDTPIAADYRMILDVMDRYDYHGETVELLRKFCIEDAAGVIAVIAQDEISQTLYIERITALASQEELKQVKESMKQLIEELSKLDGEGIQAQIDCAQAVVKSCNENIK